MRSDSPSFAPNVCNQFSATPQMDKAYNESARTDFDSN